MVGDNRDGGGREIERYDIMRIRDQEVGCISFILGLNLPIEYPSTN